MADPRPPHDALADVVKSASEQVPNGSRWRHRNGVEYVAFGVALDEHSLSPVVMYGNVNVDRPFAWCRPLSEFLDGRFTRVEYRSQQPAGPSGVRVEESSP